MSIYQSLYPFQKRIVDKFKDREAFGLFIDMGLGKTPLSLAFAEVNRCNKVLVITINSKACETLIDKGSWFDWASKSSMNYVLYAKNNDAFFDDPACFVVNYESLFKRSKDKRTGCVLHDKITAFIKNCKNQNVAIIVDESHKMKHLQSQQTKAIMQIKNQLNRVSNKVYTYLLTGTPFTTGYVDLYAQLKMLGYTATKSTFVDNFCIRGQIPGLLGWQQPIVGYKDLDRLFDTVHRFAITIKSEDVVDLPEKIFVEHQTKMSFEFLMYIREKCKGADIIKMIDKHNITLSLETQEVYNTSKIYEYQQKTHNNPFFRNIDFPNMNWLADTTGTFWMRARQLSIGFNGNANNYIWYDRRRLDQLEQFLTENEDNYVLFYNYTPELIEIYDICEKLNYNIDVYCGEIKSLTFYEKYVKQDDAQRMINKKNIILANFASGSTGMNWQLYNKCIIFSIPLYKDYEQAIKRIHRLGQKNTVFYHIFSQNNWLDEGMLKSLQESQDYSSDMFEADLRRVQELFDEETMS